MKDTDIHKHLEHREVRDFLAATIVNASVKRQRSMEVAVKEIPSTRSNWQYAVAKATEGLMRANAQYEYANTMLAIEEMLKRSEWDEFDVSNEVERTGEHWRSFIGTEQEYNELIKQLESQEE